MRWITLIVTAMVFTHLSDAAVAQSLKNADQPAEFPPASYTGKQYVDSKGCVYIRAGFDGAVTWVPRVERNRKVVCGFKPSLTAAARAPQVAPTPAPAPQAAPVRTVRAAPAPKPVRTAPQPAPRRVVAAAPAPQPKRVVRRTAPVMQPPAPMPAPRVVATAPAPKRIVVPAQTYAQGGSCQGASAVSSRYINRGQHGPVRCGPQAESPVGKTVSTQTRRVVTTAAPQAYSYGTAPRQQVQVVRRVAPVQVPQGYRRVWEDDRLNTARGIGTIPGRAQMDLVWTSTVPRQLVDRRTGYIVTNQYPGLVYPYTDYASMQQAQVRYGNPVLRTAPKSYTRQAHVSSKAVAPKRKVTAQPQRQAQPARAASHRYVQVGTFGQPSNARNAVARLQGMGLPVKVGAVNRSGRQYQIVVAGPFASQQQLNTALSTARRAGFSDAFLRK